MRSTSSSGMPVGGILTTEAPSRGVPLVPKSPSRRSSTAMWRALGQQHGALDGVLELADVAGPLIAHEELQRVRLEPDDLLLQLTRESTDEEVGQLGDVVLALAQRRHLHRHDVEPVVQVLAELAGLDHRRQIAVGRGNQSNVHLDRPRAAEPLELVLLQHAQDLGLRVRRSCRRFRRGTACRRRPARSGRCAACRRR